MKTTRMERYVWYGRRLGGVSPPLEGLPEPGNRFVLCVRAARGWLLHVVSGAKCVSCGSFPFPFWPPGVFPFPFSSLFLSPRVLQLLGINYFYVYFMYLFADS